MELSLGWQSLFAKYKDYVIIVEGARDVAALNSLGFERVFSIYRNGVSLREMIELISAQIAKKDRVCILTDFDKKGKWLYFILKRELQMMGVKLDNSLRSILLRSGISHIEGLDTFMEKLTMDKN